MALNSRKRRFPFPARAAGAEAFHMSGIIASLFCGIGMNHWTYHNFSYDGEVL
jgi:hypothetical protein